MRAIKDSAGNLSDADWRKNAEEMVMKLAAMMDLGSSSDEDI